MSAPTLKWLHIHQYEQFEDVRITFSPRENLILGVNGAGKTRLLKLIFAVLSLDFSELLSVPFDIEFDLQTISHGHVKGNEICITGRVTNARSATQRNVENAPFGPRLDLAATISYRGAEALIRTEIRGNEITYHDGDSLEKVLLPWRGALKPAYWDLQNPVMRAAIEGIQPRCEASYLGESDHEFRALSEYISFTSNAPEIRMDLETARNDLVSALFPLVLSCEGLEGDRFKEGLDLTGGEISPFLMASDAAVFTRLFAPLGVRTVRLIPKIIREKGGEFECRGIDMNVEFLDGTKLSGSELTFGQRRYLYAGIVFAFHPGVPVLVDELDNGLHPGLIVALLESWQDRQLFLVSHNKLVIDYTNFFGPADVQEKIHIVRRADDGRQSIMALDDATAQEVYDKIAVAIQNPSDVLSAEGLW